MIEFWDYLSQFLAVTAGFCAALRAYLKSREQPWFLLTCFYGTFALGTLYWTLHLLLRQETPQVFYVSDLAWLASYVFLLALTLTLLDAGERQSRTGLCWLAPVFCLPQFALYVTRGDLLLNVLMCGLTMMLAWCAVRGLVWAKKTENGRLRRFHGTVLAFISAGVRPVDGLLLLGERHPDESLLLVRFPADPRFAFVSARSAKGGGGVTYIENVFVCMAAPLVVALLSLKRGQRAALVFCLAGMGACLLSAYLNTFFARLYQADAVNAATQIAPVVEEIMKLLPLLFFLAVFEPAFARFRLAAVIVAASFATFENICFLTQNGADQILFLLIRGFGTGAMHVVCGNVYGGALRPVWDSRPLRAACLFALLCVAIIYHAIYNLLVSAGGTPQLIAYFVPLPTALCFRLLARKAEA